MVPRGGWALVVAAALLVTAPGGMLGQQIQAPVVAPQPGAQQPMRLGRPFPGSLATSQQPGAAPLRPQGNPAGPPGTAGPQRLGRGTPAPAQPPMRKEPNVSVSVVSPQNDSGVFGRRQRSGNQGSLRDRGRTGGASGAGGGFNQMGQ